jgi:hypothetical protein
MIDPTRHITHTNQEEITMSETTMKEISMTTSPANHDVKTAQPGRLRRMAPTRHWRALAVAALLALAPAGVALADAFGPSSFSATGNATALTVQAQNGTAINTLTNGTAVNADSTSGTGVQALGNTAVSASGAQFGVNAGTTTGIGVNAFSGSGTAVKASAGSGGTAVQATSTGGFGTGVFGSGALGMVANGSSIGIQAQSPTGYGGTFRGGANSAPILLNPALTVGAPRSGHHLVGELFVDKNGHLFFCTTAGTPGVFKQLA